MLKSEAAAYLAGVTQTEGAEASAPTNLHVITGEVGEASADGKTLVKIDGLMFSESDDQFIEVDALGGLEEGDIATIVLTGEQGHAMTPLALGSIGSVDRITVRIAAIEADYIKVEQLDAAKARIGELEADHVSVNDFNAATGRIGTLETTRATITDLNAATARIGTLEADHVSTDDFNAATGRIGTLEANTADIGTIRANSAKVQNLTADELEADHATVGSLSTNYAHITNGVIDNATIGYADVDNLSAHYAEIQNGKINSALIDTAAIVDEQVFTVTGNKATLAQIDASKINVLNLKAKDIEVERINGQPVTNKTLVDALSQHESDISGLDSKIDSEVEALNDRIDGAIETFTGTVVPTLDNTPASQWNTVKLKDQHVGDVYYVVNSQSAQNGYCYRFTKSGSTYSWQLIKDSDVTAALSRLQTAEGKIGNIEQFDETVGSFMTNTEDEISSLKTKDTQLETSLGDKVSTSTFNTVSQKVDTNEANITSMSTVLTNNGLTSSTNITNTVNTVRQTAETNTSNISSLQTTVSGHTTTIGQHTTAIQQNTNDISLRATKTEVQQVRPAYASSSTAAGTAAKVATIDPAVTDYALYKGASVAVTFSKANTAATPTLNLNSTGAKQIRSYTGAALSEAEYKWAAGATIDIVYDGTYWRMQDSGTVKRVTAAEASISVNAENIESKVSKNGVISSINQSAETVKIQASKVEIDGTAVFSAISSDVDDAITSKGYQTSSQVNSAITSKGYATTTQAQGYATTAKSEAISAAASDATTKANAAEANAKAYTDALEIGGRNLLLATGKPQSKTMPATDAGKYTTWDPYNLVGAYSTLGFSAGDSITISFDWSVTGAAANSTLKIGTNVDPWEYFGVLVTFAAGASNGHVTKTYTVTSKLASCAGTTLRARIDAVGTAITTSMVLTLSNVKLEKGNKATDWSPAPEDTPQYRVVTTSYSYTLAQWLTYAAEGYTSSWATGTYGQGVRAGDTVMLKGTNSDNGSAVYVLMTVNTLNSSGAISNATSHGLIDPTAGQRADSAQSTANAAAPKANAVKRTQRIYYRSSASTAPATMPTAWVTETNNKWAKNNSTVANWSTKVTPIANGTGATAEKYLYLWTCEQREMANGTLAYTNVLLDDSTTVIDGGNIITNSITANQIAANAVTADKLAANSLTIGKFTDADKAKVDNSYVQIGGRNLLAWSDRKGATGTSNSGLSWTYDADGWITVTGTINSSSAGLLLFWGTSTATNYVYPSGTYTVTVENDGLLAANVLRAQIGYDGTYTYLYDSGSLTLDTENGISRVCLYRYGADGTAVNGRVRFKMEKGNKATDWTPAPEDQTAYVDSVQIGGRNLLRNTGSPTTVYVSSFNYEDWIVTSGGNGVGSIETIADSPVPAVTRAFRITGNTSGNRDFAQKNKTLESDFTGPYRFSAWVRGVGGSVNALIRSWNNTAGNAAFSKTINGIGTDWTYIDFEFVPSGNGVKVGDLLDARFGITGAGSIEYIAPKLERGNKATDWTPAPEDQTDAVDQTYVQNLTPYFQMDMSQASDEYWANLTHERFTRLGDGWAHFEYTNSGTKTVNNFIKLKLLDFLEPGSKYTLLAEFKNVSISADGGAFYSQQGSDVQVWGDSSYCGFSITNATIRALSGGAGTFYRTLTLLTADSKDPSGTVRGSLPKTSFMSINQQVQVNQTVSYDLRLSLYADGYTGVYKPYVGSQLYATGKSLSDSQDFLDERIDGLDDRTTGVETSLETTSGNLTAVDERLKALDKQYTDEKNQRDQWMNFTSSQGLSIGDKDSTFKTVVTSTSMEFKNGDATLAEASGTEFIANIMRSEELHIGKWMWTKRNEGNNLSLKWVG